MDPIQFELECLPAWCSMILHTGNDLPEYYILLLHKADPTTYDPCETKKKSHSQFWAETIWIGHHFTSSNLSCVQILHFNTYRFNFGAGTAQSIWWLGYRLDFLGNRVLFPSWEQIYRLCSVHTGSGTYPLSYSMGIRGSFLKGEMAKAWNWPLTPYLPQS